MANYADTAWTIHGAEFKGAALNQEVLRLIGEMPGEDHSRGDLASALGMDWADGEVKARIGRKVDKLMRGGYLASAGHGRFRLGGAKGETFAFGRRNGMIQDLVRVLRQLGGQANVKEIRRALDLDKETWKSQRYYDVVGSDDSPIRRDYKESDYYNLAREQQADLILRGRNLSYDANRYLEALPPERVEALLLEVPGGTVLHVEIAHKAYQRIGQALTDALNLWGLDYIDVANADRVRPVVDELYSRHIRNKLTDWRATTKAAIKAADAALEALSGEELAQGLHERRGKIVEGVADGDPYLHRLDLSPLWQALADELRLDAALLSRGFLGAKLTTQYITTKGNPNLQHFGVADGAGIAGALETLGLQPRELNEDNRASFVEQASIESGYLNATRRSLDETGQEEFNSSYDGVLKDLGDLKLSFDRSSFEADFEKAVVELRRAARNLRVNKC